MRKFLWKICLLVCLVMVIVLPLNWMYLVKVILSEDVVKFYHVPEKVTICNFGSSHGNFGYDYQNCVDRQHCFNFAMDSQSLDYDWRIMQQYQGCITKGTRVYITVSYFSLFGEDESNNSDFESKNNRYYYFLQPEYIKQLAISKYLLIKYFPVLLSPYHIRDAIKKKDSRPVGPVIHLASDIDVMKDAEAAYIRHIVSQKFDKAGKRIINRQAVQVLGSMIKLCQSKGAVPILVTTPYLKEYTDIIQNKDPAFYPAFYALIDVIKKQYGAEYYDYAFDKRFATDYTLSRNADHLNERGAVVFTDILMRETLNFAR